MIEDDAKGGVRSVEVALNVLEAVAFSGDEVGVTQVAERLKLTKGSVHRHLITLVERGYLTQNPVTSRYAIGPRSRLLARHAPDSDLVQLAAGPMRELRDQLGHSVVLSESTSSGALILSMVRGTAAIEIGVRPGSELPFHSSAQGKVLLAFAPRPQLQRALARPLQSFTSHTVVDAKQLEEELSRVARFRIRDRAGRGDARHQCRRGADLQRQGHLRRSALSCRLDPVPSCGARRGQRCRIEGGSRANLANAGSRPCRAFQGSAFGISNGMPGANAALHGQRGEARGNRLVLIETCPAITTSGLFRSVPALFSLEWPSTA